MPAVYNSLVSNGLTSSQAWRVSFVIPGILIVSVALGLLLFCPDTPTGVKWSERDQVVPRSASTASPPGQTVQFVGSAPAPSHSTDEEKLGGEDSKAIDEKKREGSDDSPSDDNEPQVGEQYEVDAAQHEIIQKPTWKEAMKVVLSPQTLVLAAVSSILKSLILICNIC